ncbi:testis-specific serine/threonine-protein kinase 3-like [Amphibalanus amphitrite]|nr:testis-specific serine/threonine-protein kinase 3-like [Amphibalanus amphitrite]
MASDVASLEPSADDDVKKNADEQIDKAKDETVPEQTEATTADDAAKNAAQSEAEEKKVSVMEAHGYLLGTILGTGSYATVKMAFSSRHKCKVAVKIVSKKKSPTSYVHKFLPREIDAVRILRHPNIICFLQSIETTNRVYLIMEVADGGDVLKAIRDSKHIEEPDAGRWFGQVLGAVDYCHKRGVVHRDLKCENLLLDRAKNIKITDFGFARVFDPKEAMEPSSTFCGSYPYAPPEILRGIAYHPPSADVWSMGVILFTMVFGRLPFDDHNHRTLIKQVMAGPVFPARHAYQLKASTELRDLLVKILKPMPARPGLDSIRQDTWFAKHCAGSVVVKQSKDGTSLMEVLKEDESPAVESEDAFSEF